MMKQSKNEKPLPLWAIWLITIIGVIAWCGVHPADDAEPAWPISTTVHRA
ncbi:TPA: hypothetical protein QDA94_002783 [Burkholderia vietnamiensis]|nr:hypothetical protein [Burkholderia vietnamiensis]HDR9200998.1 hypothetical protein [Burkholderia vietnamiensis]HDR9231815.1 hypothetical protein [Burkholderia vietnamiensis]